MRDLLRGRGARGRGGGRRARARAGGTWASRPTRARWPTAAARGVVIEGVGRQVAAADFGRADLLLAMDRANRDALLALAPGPAERAKVRLLRSFDPEAVRAGRARRPRPLLRRRRAGSSTSSTSSPPPAAGCWPSCGRTAARDDRRGGGRRGRPRPRRAGDRRAPRRRRRPQRGLRARARRRPPRVRQDRARRGARRRTPPRRPAWPGSRRPARWPCPRSSPSPTTPARTRGCSCWRGCRSARPVPGSPRRSAAASPPCTTRARPRTARCRRGRTAPSCGWGRSRCRRRRPADWPSCYAEQRVAPLLRAAQDRGALPDGCAARVEAVLARLPALAGPPEPPARLHGDLWGGNVLAAGDGTRPVLIDPAAHGGHREVDLAMLALFGAPGGVERVVAAYARGPPARRRARRAGRAVAALPAARARGPLRRRLRRRGRPRGARLRLIAVGRALEDAEQLADPQHEQALLVDVDPRARRGREDHVVARPRRASRRPGSPTSRRPARRRGRCRGAAAARASPRARAAPTGGCGPARAP